MAETLETNDAAELVAGYLAAWNATDPAERNDRIADAFTEGATYIDPLASASGRDDIAALIGAMQEQFPGLAFRSTGKIDLYRDRLRFSWELAMTSGAAVAGGTDFAVVSDGRLASVTGFLDFVPAG